MWALGAGGAVYAMTGDLMTAGVVAGIGGGFGGMVDRFGPRIVQRILDGYLKIEGLPTMKKLVNAMGDLPKPVVEQMKGDLIRSIATTEDEEVPVAPENIESVRYDILESGLSPMKKAKMIYALERGKPLSSRDLSAVVVGQEDFLPPIMWTKQ